MRAKCQNRVIAPCSLEVNSILRINPGSVKAVIPRFDQLNLQRRVADVPAEKPECPDEFAFQILLVGIEFIPDTRWNRDCLARRPFVISWSFD